MATTYQQPYRARTGAPTTPARRHTLHRIGTSSNDWAAIQAAMTAWYDARDV